MELVFYCEFTDINIAIEKEKQIKKWSKIKKEALINGEFESLINLAKKRFHKWRVLNRTPFVTSSVLAKESCIGRGFRLAKKYREALFIRWFSIYFYKAAVVFL